MNRYTRSQIISFFMIPIIVLYTSACTYNDPSGISQIDDIETFDAVISLKEIEYQDSDYTDYIAFFDFDELLDILTYQIKYRSDDCEVTGYIALPANYQEKEYPILIYNRGGNRTYGMLSPSEVAAYSNFGFIVMATQYRGVDGGTGIEDYGGDDVQNVINLVDIAEQLSFSNGKIYMLGASRGGLETYCALKEENIAGKNRISAAVVMCGIADLRDYYVFRESGMQYILETLVGGRPDELPDEYERRSAVCWPEQINTPLLILHGVQDEAVPVEQAETMYDLLSSLDKAVELKLYDAGHNLTRESDLYAFEWLLTQ